MLDAKQECAVAAGSDTLALARPGSGKTTAPSALLGYYPSLGVGTVSLKIASSATPQPIGVRECGRPSRSPSAVHMVRYEESS